MMEWRANPLDDYTAVAAEGTAVEDNRDPIKPHFSVENRAAGLKTTAMHDWLKGHTGTANTVPRTDTDAGARADRLEQSDASASRAGHSRKDDNRTIRRS